MANVSWKNNASGSWGVAGNWTPAGLPTSVDDVTIVAPSAITVTHGAGTDTIHSLYTAATDSLNLTGGSLSLIAGSTMYGGFGQSAGTLVVGAGLTSYGSFKQSGGSIAVRSGTLALGGSGNSIAGSVSGGGTLQFNTGSTTLAATALTIAHVQLASGTLTLGAALNYAGSFVETGGTLALNGKVATLTGSEVVGGTVNGIGTLALNGAAQLVGGGVTDGSVIMSIGGTTSLVGTSYDLGISANSTAQIQIQAGGTLRLVSGGNIATLAVKSKVTNAGTILSGAGTNMIAPSMTDTGVITSSTGTLELLGSANSIAGAVGGTGTLAFTAGTTTLKLGTALTVANVLINGGTVSLATGLSYAGSWSQTSGVLTLVKPNALSLTGPATLTGGSIFGGGALTLASAELGGGLFLDTTSTVAITGTGSQTGNIYISYQSSSTGSLNIGAAATYTMQENVNIFGGAGAALFSNAGTVLKTASVGPSTIQVNTTSTGTISVAGGVLAFSGAANSFAGTISGAGAVAFNGGTSVLHAGLALTVGQIAVGGGTTEFAAGNSFAGLWNQTAGITQLDSDKVSLSGATVLMGEITGTGTLATSGATILSGTDIEGATTVSVAGAAEQAATIYVGQSTSGPATLAVLSGGSYQIDDSSILSATGTGTLNNAGTVTGSSSASAIQIQTAVINTGNVEATSGGMNFLSTVSGAGTIKVDNGASVEFGGSVSAASTVAFGGASGLLTIDQSANFAATINGFAGSDEVALNGFNFLTAQPLTFAGGVLTVSDGTSTANLAFGGSGLTLASFSLGQDSAGGIGIFHT